MDGDIVPLSREPDGCFAPWGKASAYYPGDGRPKPVRFPDPKDVAVYIDGVKTVSLEKLVELKLASGTSAPDRLKDLADVQELIKVKDLAPDFVLSVDPSVREKFNELHRAVRDARERNRGEE